MIPTRPRSRHKVEAIPAVTPPRALIADAVASGDVPRPARGQCVRDGLETWRPKAAAKGAGL